jgi:hypothetical protein
MIWPGFAIGYVEKVAHFRASLDIPEATRVSYCQYNAQRSTELRVSSGLEPEHIAAMASAYERAARTGIGRR